MMDVLCNDIQRMVYRYFMDECLSQLLFMTCDLNMMMEIDCAYPLDGNYDRDEGCFWCHRKDGSWTLC